MSITEIDRRRLRGLSGTDEDVAAARIAHGRIGRALRVARRRADLVPPAGVSSPTPLDIARTRDWRRQAMAVAAIAAAIVLIFLLIPHPQEARGGSLSGAPSSLERAFAVTIQSVGGRGRTTGVLPAIVAAPSPSEAPAPQEISSAAPVALIAPPLVAVAGPGGPGAGGTGTSGLGTGSFGNGSGTGAGNGSGNTTRTPPPTNPPPPPPAPTPAPLPPVPPPGFFRFTVHVNDGATGYGVPDACVGVGSLDCSGLLKRTDASGYWTTDFPLALRATTFYVIVDKARYQRLATNAVVAPTGNVVVQLWIFKLP